MSRYTVPCAVFSLIFAAANAVAQQAATTQLSLSAGSATDITGLTSRAASIAPSLSVVLSPRASFALAASGTHFAGGAWSVLGGVAAVAREPIGPLAITLDTRASFTETSYDRSYLTADITPALEARVHAITLFAGVHSSHATSWALETGQTPRFPGPFPGPLPQTGEERQATTRWGNAVVYGAKVHVPLGDRTPLTLAYRDEHGRVADALQVDRTFSVAIARGALSLMGAANVREMGDESLATGTAAFALALTATTSFEASAGRYPGNRLTGNAGGRFVNAGFAIRLSGAEKTLPKPSGVPPVRPGLTRLSIAARDAQKVEVAGDFTRWQHTATQRAENGVWYVDLRIAPGRYRYAFRIDDKEWRTPDGAVTADDGFGGRSALLTIDRSATGR